MANPLTPANYQHIALPGLPEQAVMLNQADKEVQARKIQLSFEMGWRMAEAMSTLRSEKQVLESENRKLEKEVTSLTAVHVAELGSRVENYRSNRTLIAARVNAIMQKIQAYSSKCECPNSVFSSTRTALFEPLYITISQFNYEGFKRYPDYPTQTNTPPTAAASPNPAVALYKTNQLISFLTQESMDEKKNEYTGLEKRIAEIKGLNNTLIAKKASMVTFHTQHLKEMDRQEKEIRLKSLLDAMRSVNSTIKWGDPITPAEINGKFGLHCSPFTARIHTEHAQNERNEKIKEIQACMRELIAFLEGMVV